MRKTRENNSSVVWTNPLAALPKKSQNLKTNKTRLIAIRKDKQETNSGSIVVKDEYEMYSISIVVSNWKQYTNSEPTFINGVW